MSRISSKAILLVVLFTTAASQAAVPPDLYVAQVPVAGLSGAPLDEAFARALADVLVKVTGERGIASQPERRRALGTPGALVGRYQPIPGGQLRVSFDPVALRRRLDAANLPVWADDRPLTLISVPADESLRRLLNDTAASRGIPIAFAGAGAAGATNRLTGEPAPTGGPAFFRWTFARGDDRWEWQGDGADGIHGLADRLASRYATVASTGRVLRLRVTGVDSFDAYGQLQSYLAGLGFIRDAVLREVAPGELVYEVNVRGDATQFNEALALRRLLEPVPEAGELVYRLVTGSDSPVALAP